MKIRNKGTGTIQRQKNGRYKGAIYVTTIDGTRKRVSKTCDTRQEVEAFFRKMTKTDLKTFNPMTVSEYFEHYLQLKEHVYRESTLAGVRLFYNKHVRGSVIDTTKFYDLTAQLINRYFLGLASHGYSASTLVRWRKNFKSVLEMAVYEGYLDSNPMSSPQAIKKLKGKPSRAIQTFSKKEVHTLLLPSNLKKLKLEYQTYILLAFLTGARPQEILALEQNDISPAGVSYTKSLGFKGKLQDCMKTESSVRVVPIDTKYYKILCKNKKTLPEQLFKSSRSEYGYLNIDNINMIFKKYVANVLGKPNHHLYDTRHTYATLLIVEDKINVKTVSRLLGHSNVETTLKYYTHVNPSNTVLRV